jgi:hypothetical protein
LRCQGENVAGGRFTAENAEVAEKRDGIGKGKRNPRGMGFNAEGAENAEKIISK